MSKQLITDANGTAVVAVLRNTGSRTLVNVPVAIEAGAPRGYAQGGSLDGSRPGAFYINLVNTSIWPKWALPTLNHHESVPGHLWQGAIVNTQNSLLSAMD